MSFILGISEGSQVAIGLGLLTLLISFVSPFFIMKTKTEKGDILIEVDKKVDDKIRPIKKRLEKHEDSINKIVNKQTEIDVKIDCIGEDVKDIKKLLGKVFDVLDNKKDK
jgi:hypothetical protein